MILFWPASVKIHCDASVISDVILWRGKLVIALFIKIITFILHFSRFNDGESCTSSCENEQPCFPIKIPEDDPRIKRYKCMEFTRSSAVCGSGSTSVFFDSITPRQQVGAITVFKDMDYWYFYSENPLWKKSQVVVSLNWGCFVSTRRRLLSY